MPLVVFLRGANVGGHRVFRPSAFARELSQFEVVNVGAAGTFIVWKPGSAAKFRAELLRKLPFEAEVALCPAAEIVRLAAEDPFGAPPPAGVVRFVSVLVEPGRARPKLPLQLPAEGEWLMRLLSVRDRFVFGEYRRHMKTIGYLGQIDKLLGGRATTRNWNTMMSLVRILEKGRGKARVAE